MSIHRYQLKSRSGYKAVVQVSPTKQLSKKFRLKSEAQAWEARTREALRQGEDLATKKQAKPTLDSFSGLWLERYARGRKEPSSVIRDEGLLRNQILPGLGRYRISDLSADVVETWQRSLQANGRLSVKTCNLALGLLRKMLNDAVRWRIIPANPVAPVSFLPKAERDLDFWTLADASQFLRFVASKDRKSYEVYCVALYTGLRRGELQGLRWDCVDLAARQITVKRSYCEKERRLKEKTKSKRIRHVPISNLLHDLLVELRRNTDGLFVMAQDFDFSHAARRLRQLAQAAGVKPIRFHDLRHTFASNFMMGRGSIYDLQKILGHSTIAMTERYSHLSPEHLHGKTDFLNFGAEPVAKVISLRR